MKKLIVISVTILAALCFLSFNARADGWTDGWTVVSCGANPDLGTYLILSDGSTILTAWPRVDVEGYPNQALAIGMTAQSMDKKVVIGSFVGGRFGLIQMKID